MLGRGALTGLDRLTARLTIERLYSDQLALFIPASSPCPACGYNPFTRAALDASCLTCLGTGLITTWQRAYVRCRAMWVDAAKLHLHQGLVAGEIGDAQIQGRVRDQALYQKVYETEGAYILFDGKRLRPKSITLNRTETATSLDVRCNITGSE